MRCFKINWIEFYTSDEDKSLDRNDFTGFDIPLIINVSKDCVDDLEDDDEIFDEICCQLRIMFGYTDVYYLNYEEVNTFYKLYFN